jgi:hypothetical protein
MTALNLSVVQDNKTLLDNEVYYIFQNENFMRLSEREIEDYKNRTTTVY